ncbi:hypothetical protein ABZ477_08685 [Microbacterium sp. NPDC019599]|uniref:O-antigen ligase family protein n=1 Tax=Microbacterium sp. NPDC019599 TaxID=3154690 RepID=UPI0033F0D7C8
MTAKGHLVVRRSARGRLQILGAVLAALVLAALTTAALLAVAEPSIELAVALPVLAVVGVLAFALPVHTLPALALAVLALVPTRLIPNDGPFNALPPLAILMGIWVFRRFVLGQRPPGDEAPLPDHDRMGPRFAVYATAGLLAVWLGISTVLGGISETTLGWTLSFVVSVLLPLLVFDARAEARLLARVFLVLGAIVGGYLLVEGTLGTSPIYGLLVGGGDDFMFSVYRARAAFSHPLFASAFLTIPAALGIGTWLVSGRRWALVCGALAAAGVVMTVSRGAIAAIGVAVGFALLIGPVFIGWKNVTRWLQLLGITVVGGVLVLNFGPLVQRAGSIESQLSAGVRDRAIEVALQASQVSGWLGTGPGTSGVTGRLFDDIIIENSMLQLLISVGIPGLLLFLLLMASLMWQAWVRGNLGIVLAIIAYVVAISGFNSLDAVRAMHVILGFLVIIATHGAASFADAPKPMPAFAQAKASEPRIRATI